MWTNQFIEFFFLTFFNEDKVVELTNDALLRFHKEKNKMLGQKKSEEVIFVEVSKKVWEKHAGKYPLDQEKIEKQSLFTSSPVYLEPWLKYAKSARPEEMLAVLWSNVFEISDEQIAQGLGLSTGTVRHRLRKGLQGLGTVRQHLNG